MKELSLKQNLIWNTVGCLIYQGCQWLTTIAVVVLSVSYENSGALAFAMAVGNIFVSLATYNMRTFQVSDINNVFSSNNYVAFRCITLLASSVICIVYSAITTPTQYTFIAVVLFLLFKIDETFTNVLYTIDQKHSRMDYIGISQILRGMASIAAFSAALFVFDSLAVAIAAMTLICMCITVLYDIPHTGSLDSITPRITVTEFWMLFRACTPAVLSLLCYSLVSAFARQRFGIQYGEEALGVYAAVATPCVLVQVLASYLYNPFILPISRKLNHKDYSGAAHELAKLGILMIVTIAVSVLGAFIVGPHLLPIILGDSISSSAWMVGPATLAASAMAIASLTMDLFIVMRKYVCAVAVNMVALLACVALYRPCISLWYMNGVNILIITSFAAGIFSGLLLLILSLRFRKSTGLRD